MPVILRKSDESCNRDENWVEQHPACFTLKNFCAKENDECESEDEYELITQNFTEVIDENFAYLRTIWCVQPVDSKTRMVLTRVAMAIAQKSLAIVLKVEHQRYARRHEEKILNY